MRFVHCCFRGACGSRGVWDVASSVELFVVKSVPRTGRSSSFSLLMLRGQSVPHVLVRFGVFELVSFLVVRLGKHSFCDSPVALGIHCW